MYKCATQQAMLLLFKVRSKKQKNLAL